MKISAGLPTGVSAALFDSARRRRRLEARLSTLLEERGFAEVLLPILDYFEPYRPLLTGRRLEQLYRFVDRDGQLLVLRGDFTPMLARLLAPHLDELELPLRLYYRGDVVRHQPLRPGRMREYSQLGAELLGGDEAEADERMLTLFFDLLLEARGEAPVSGDGEEHTLRVVLGVAGALDEALLAAAGEREASDLALRIASRDRTAARRAGLADVVERGYPADLSVLGGAGEAVSELLGLRDRLSSAYRDAGVEIEVDLAEFAAAALDPRIGVGDGRRGYYDGLMFAAYAPGTALALGVGGRYDKVFRSLSGDCSAVGFSFGLDLLLELGAAEARS
ncbi:MAG: ATP phosphoribosyltransferase regulatory subunit [Acidobacteriota bacterium]|nr:ATP phosphoribosyltransferase regulatory subunit [Acidobacteriota bacterium]MDE3264757.1 ATP phosphoribosyltransferase regulatory subunit [Acidobacteriota bacterium]